MRFLKQEVAEKLSDEKIIELYFKRDEDAIKQTDRKYGNYLMSVAEYIVHNRLDSEECLNDTYLAAWNTIPPERPKLLKAFLTAIMRNVAIRKYRMKTSSKRIPANIIDPLSDFEEILTTNIDMQEEYKLKELGDSINEYVESLSERREYIFMARYYFSRPISEIAEALGVSISTVNKDITAIKVGLRQKLESEGYIL